jgi:AsmA-like C-terminal region
MRSIPRWFIISVVLIMLVPAMTAVANHSVVNSMIIQWLKDDAGLEMSSLRVRLVPRLAIKFTDLIVHSVEQPEPVFQAQRGTLTLRLMSLFKKEVAIVRVIAEEPEILIVRDRRGRWHSPFHGNQGKVPDNGERGFRLNWLLPDVEISEGSAVFIDEYERTSPQEITLKAVNGIVESRLFRTSAEVAISGTIGETEIALKGSLTMSTTTPALQFQGSLHIERLDFLTWVPTPGTPALDAGGPRYMDVDTRVAALWTHNGYHASLKEAEARLPWVTVHASGEVEAVGSDPRYSLTLSASPVSLHTILEELPQHFVPNEIRTVAMAHHMSGSLELVSATMTGEINQPQSSWRGTAKLTQGGATFGKEHLPVEHVRATVFFDQSTLEILNISGNVGALRVSDGKLDVTHLDVRPLIDIVMAGVGKASDLLSLFKALSEDSAGQTVLSAITDPQGEVQLSIHAAGPLVPVPEVTLLNAEITLHDLGAHMPRLDLSAEHLDGTVAVKRSFIEFKHLRGTIGPVRFDAVGGATMEQRPRFEDLIVELDADGEHLQQVVSRALSTDPGIALHGLLRATVHLSGPVSAPRWKGKADLTDVAIHAKPVLHKRPTVMSSLEFDGTWVPAHRLSVRHIVLVLPSARLEGRADIRLGSSPSFTAQMHVGPIALEQLADEFSLGAMSAGVITGRATLKGGNSDWQSWIASGRIDLKRGTLGISGLRDPVRQLSLGLQLANRDLLIRHLSFKIGDSDITGTGFVKNWTTEPTPTLFLESSRLDLTRLLPTGRDGTNGTLAIEKFRDWLHTSQANVTAAMKQVHYHRLLFTTVVAQLKVSPSLMQLDIMEGKTLQGELSGRVVTSDFQRQGMVVDTQMRLTGMPIQQLLSLLDPELDRLRGLLSLEGELRVTIDPRISLLPTLESRRPVRLRLTDGRVVHGRILPKVLKMLNMPAMLQGKVDLEHDGIPFNLVSATVSAERGVLNSEDIIFDSPIMKMTGAGTLSLPADDLNLALAVTPLGAYSDIIDKIPLFGKLLEGDRPGLSTALFEATGSLRDPDVRYLPLESIAKGLTGYPRLAIDVLKNFVTLPQDLIPATPQ